MARAESSQLNIRSQFARERVAIIAKQTGMTTTQVIEDALRSYQPATRKDVPGRLVRKGHILVRPSGKKRVTLEEANEALEADRAERP